KAHELVREAEKHGEGSCPITPRFALAKAPERYPHRGRSGGIRTDAQGVTAHLPDQLGDIAALSPRAGPSAVVATLVDGCNTGWRALARRDGASGAIAAVPASGSGD